MYDRDGIKILSDAELHSDSAHRLQDIQRRLAQISKRLLLLNVAVWLILEHFPTELNRGFPIVRE
jgi:hypothetical protein